MTSARSALPASTDIVSLVGHVRFVPHKQTFEARAAATLTEPPHSRPAANNNVRHWLAGGKVRPAQQRLLP